MAFIVFIPARGGSKSIPLKNIKDFCGKPLIYWNLKELNSINEIDQIYVATDSEKIKEVVSSFNFAKVKIYNRDSENAQDQSSTENAMLEFINKNNLASDDIFMLVQITNPFTQELDFKKSMICAFIGGILSAILITILSLIFPVLLGH